MSDRLPPIPEPGFYWAKTVRGRDQWEPVLVEDYSALGYSGRRVGFLDYEDGCRVIEWGPRLEPPR